MTSSTDARQRLNVMWVLAAGMLLLPAIAMRFIAEVAWDGADFVAFGAMLLVAGAAIELAVRLTQRGSVRLMAIAGIAGLFLVLWAELAVGIF